MAVQVDDEEDLWALYFDRHGNGLRSKSLIGDAEAMGRRYRMLAVQLIRKERPYTIDDNQPS